MEHTPGPYKQHDGVPSIILGADGQQVADCSGIPGCFFYVNRPQRERFANAYLFAAAPDMLDALEDHRARCYCNACEFIGTNADYIEHEDRTCGRCGDGTLEMVWIISEKSALAATAKAKGV